MNALLLLRSRRAAVGALGAVLFGALALTAQRLPGAIPGLELLLIGALGAAIGRLTIGIESREVAPGEQQAQKAEAVDRLLRSIARLIQTHMTDSDAFSERLHRATDRLSKHPQAGPVNEIVLALIADNRDMRDRLASLRNQLEESRLRALRLQNELQRSEEAGMRDTVTMIGNRRFFDSALAEELEKARNVGADFCLALADLDRFKLVNDRFGHPVGDRLLRLFAEILSKNVRSEDRVARFGGEEFAVMFPGASLEEAATAVDRIRKILETKNWTIEPSGERVGKITASFGVARLRPNETGADLLKRVDQRLYDAKAKGRNCVVADNAYEASPSDGRLRGPRAASG